MECDVAIIGAGPVGIFAAFQAGILGMKSCIIDALESIGGQCIELYPQKYIYDIPAYQKITAKDLVENLKNQAANFKPKYFLGQKAQTVSKSGSDFVIKTSKDSVIKSKAIIIAAGAGAFEYNKLPIPSAKKFEDKTLFYSVKKKEIFYDKKVLIAGGGDSAADWAVILSKIAKKVYLVHRRAKFRCMQDTINTIKKLESEGKITLVVPYQIEDIAGIDGAIKKIALKKIGSESVSIEADYLLAFFGLKPNLEDVKTWGIEVLNNHIKVDPINYRTNTEGIYAIGDVAAYPEKLKLIMCGFAEAATVCHHILRNIFAKRAYNFQHSTNMTEMFKD